MSLWQELNTAGRAVAIGLLAGIAVLISSLVLYILPSSHIAYSDQGAAVLETGAFTAPSPRPPVIRKKTPEAVKGIYMTACIAGTPSLRGRILETIKGTGINSIVIDIKDYTGTLVYDFPGVRGPRGRGCRIVDLPSFIADLHKKDIYAIARVTVFQDPLYADAHPALAVQSAANPGKPWVDRNGLAYIDPNSRDFWDYITSIAKGAYEIGFDEINFDYIRFPSDGDTEDMMFNMPSGLSRVDVMTEFFGYLDSELRPSGIVTSADIFGQTTVNRDDMGIGQVLESVLPYFDYVAPMNYPSHYISGFMGYDNPASKPYEIIKGTMVTAVERTLAASSSIDKLRPWLQAFDMGADYTPEMVHAQVRGVHDAGLDSWMLWDAANRYKREAL